MRKIILGIAVAVLTAFLVVMGGGWPTSTTEPDGEEVVACVASLTAIGRANLAAVSDGRSAPRFRPQESIGACKGLSPLAYEVARDAALERLAS